VKSPLDLYRRHLSQEPQESEPGLPIAMLHYIAQPPLNGPLRGLFFTPAALRRLLTSLRQAGYQTVCPSAFETFAPEGKPNVVTLTFDDAASNLVTNALPELVRNAFSSITFVVAGKIGGWNDWDEHLGATPVRLADDAQLRDWIAAGQRIASHGISHRSLTKISEEEARREIVESKAQLEDRFGVEIEDFCYPYGDMTPRLADIVAEAGYKTACTVVPGMNPPDADPFTLRRHSIQHRRPWLAAVMPGVLSPWC
jgi:peptidoglycan/xylan/chitin deacetylase (PgdA/CDA1 family)